MEETILLGYLDGRYDTIWKEDTIWSRVILINTMDYLLNFYLLNQLNQSHL
jgi:hypothetical protein